MVVSAVKGVTDALLQVTKGNKSALEDVESRYISIASELGSVKLIKRVEEELAKLRRVVESASDLKFGDLALVDQIVSYGERISKIILVQALELNDVKAFELNATDVIVTNDTHGDASIDYAATAPALEKVYLAIKDSNYVPVIEGFIGATSSRVITTLGRGGSDYTATTIAALLKLDKVFLVTDVDGIMTTDPDLVPSAKLVKYMSYSEALEASLYGAKGINPKSFEPLEKVYSSKVMIGSWRFFGTTIAKEVPTGFTGPKIMMLKEAQENSYIAIIGEHVSKAQFIRSILDIAVEEGIDIKGLQAHVHRPSAVLYVDKDQGLKALKVFHKALFERG